jgi:small conductance mechanosensitive channel
MATNIIDEVVADAPSERAETTVELLREYGALFVNGLYLIVIGVVVVFLLHRFASKYIYHRVRNRRLVGVLFGFLYAMVLAVTGLLALDKMGVDVLHISKLVFLTLTLVAVAVYFLVPFFPKLPFKLGQMVEIGGVLGFVDSISHFHTTIRQLDGTMVFIPNPLVLSSKISNIHFTPTRRVDIALSVNNNSDLAETQNVVLQLMKEDQRVLDEPSPPAVFVVGAMASGVDMMAFCWVNNADWMSARSDLWLKLLDAFEHNDRICMSLPKQEVFVKQVESSESP